MESLNCLRLLRAERSWSQGDLAERIGVSRQTVNAIENGRPIEQMFEHQNEDQRD